MNHLQQYLVDEFVEDYREGELSRREALRRIAGITGMAAAVQLLAACGQPVAADPTAAPAPTDAPAATNVPPTPVPNSVGEDDPSVTGSMVTFPGLDAELMGYLARPGAEGAYPVVLVCHENRGLTPHIKDVARRLAKAGYVGLAVDLLSREGGSDAITDRDSIPELRAAVPFYGPPAPAEQIPNIVAPVLAIYGEQDERITSTLPATEQAMQASGKTFKSIVYPGVNHAFHNDTGTRYNAEAAQQAWAATLEWFGEHV